MWHNADPTNAEEVHSRCLAPGFWRRCRGCLTNPRQPVAEVDKVLCTHCGIRRAPDSFATASDMCKPCEQHNLYQVYQCTRCGKLEKGGNCMWIPAEAQGAWPNYNELTGLTRKYRGRYFTKIITKLTSPGVAGVARVAGVACAFKPRVRLVLRFVFPTTVS